MTVALAMPDPDREPSLEDAIEQLINLGESDPITITRRLANLHGGDWIARELASHWEEIIAEIARQKLGQQRRAAVLTIGARSRQGAVSKKEAVLTTLFVPRLGYIKLGEATAQDLLEAAAYRRRLAVGLLRWSDWLESLAAMISEQAVEKVKELKGSLPDLPAPELEP